MLAVKDLFVARADASGFNSLPPTLPQRVSLERLTD
jgi:hypothetical protein